MSILNALMRRVVDALLFPFRDLHPMVGLGLASLLVTVLVLLVVKATSNQDKLDAVKRKIHAGLFEIRLFNDDLRAILRAQWDIVRHNGTYLALWLVPLLWLIIPLMLILGQLQYQYGYRGLEPGEQVLLTVEMKDASAAKPEVRLDVPDGLRAETPAVWVPSLNQLTWRLAAEANGDYALGVQAGGETFTKSVRVTDGVRRISPVRPSSGFFDQLLYPAEAPLPAAAPIQSITLAYPEGNAGFSGWESSLTWMLVLFVLSFAFALALRKPLGVTI